MAFWSRGPKKMRPQAWIRAEARSLLREAKSLESRAAQLNGVGHSTREATLVASAPIYQALARLAGKCEALKGLAWYLRAHGSLDGYLSKEITDLNEFVSAFYRDYQQSLGLMLFYPNLNGRLLPPNFSGEQYNEALRIGAEAAGKFIAFWKSDGSKYSDNQGGPAEAYAAFMGRYTADTGRPAARLDWDKPPDDIAAPPRPTALEYRDGRLTPVQDEGK